MASVRLAGPDGERRLVAIADTGHHRVVVADTDGTPVAVAGSGRPGADDGPLAQAGFRGPHGLTAWNGGLVVADTGNHLLRHIDLRDGTVRTLAGTGTQARGRPDGGAARGTPLNSPWDVEAWDGGVAVAMAGAHQLWWLSPDGGRLDVLAGTGAENLVDGAAREALLAQPSGVAAHGDRLYVADAESSALRVLQDGHLRSLVGQGLFVFGHRDGPAAEALLQHPVGVTVTPAGVVLVADTYNGAVRVYGPASGRVATLATGLSEPGGVAATPDGRVLVADTGAHRIVEVRSGGVRAFPLPGLAPPVAADADIACVDAC